MLGRISILICYPYLSSPHLALRQVLRQLSVLLRFGLLATATCFLLINLVASYPLTFDTSAPYFVTGLVGILVIVVLMITALRIALAGQTVFTDSLLDT